MNVRTDELVHQLYFDTITTAAAAKGLINTSVYSRQQVRESLRQYYHAQKFDSWSMYCPTDQQLELLLDQSLRFERELIWPSVPQELMYYMEAEHRGAFEARTRDGSFCQLDITASLDAFRDFFRTYSK